jgi:hypothetical protein
MWFLMYFKFSAKFSFFLVVKKRKKLGNQRKLTIPFAINKNAGIHINKVESGKNIDTNNIIDEKRSIALRGSPVNTKSPLSNKRPEQKSVS